MEQIEVDWSTSCGGVDLQAIATRNERQYPFLRLPAELRNRVYTYVLGGCDVELCYQAQCMSCQERHMDNTLLHHYPRDLLQITQTCRQVHSEANQTYGYTFEDARQAVICPGCRACIPPYDQKTYTLKWHYPASLLGLLETCRMIHSETKLLPFINSTFIGVFGLDAYMTSYLFHSFNKVQLYSFASMILPGVSYPRPTIDEEMWMRMIAAYGFGWLASLGGLKTLTFSLKVKYKAAMKQDLIPVITKALEQRIWAITGREDVKIDFVCG